MTYIKKDRNGVFSTSEPYLQAIFEIFLLANMLIFYLVEKFQISSKSITLKGKMGRNSSIMIEEKRVR